MKRRKSQNATLCQLYVKHRMYKELKEFKASSKLPESERMTVKQKWVIISELVALKNTNQNKGSSE